MPISVKELLAGFLAAVVLAACGATQTPPTRSDSGHLRNSSANGAEAGYSRVLASTTIDGGRIQQEKRATALVFFASWCGHCRRELAVLGHLRERYPKLRIIGLNAYEEFRDFSDQQRLRTYIDENAPWLTEVVTADEAMRETFGKIPKIPSLFLYDGNGNVVAEFRRDKAPPPDEAQLEEAIRSALQAD